MKGKITVRNMGTREFAAFLKKASACCRAMKWYNQQPRRDMKSIVATVEELDWLAWLIYALYYEERITIKDLVVVNGAPYRYARDEGLEAIRGTLHITPARKAPRANGSEIKRGMKA